MTAIPPRWPDVYAALLAGLPTLPAFAGVSVFDGEPVSNDAPVAWVTVGFVTDEGAGTFQQVPDTSGFGTVEVGDIRCHIAANAGDTDMTITRGQAFALLAAWQGWVFNNPTLDGRVPGCELVNLSAQVETVQNSQGSATGLIVTVSYQANTFIA